MHIYCSVGPLECIFIALLALFNEGVPDHFPILWLRWPFLLRGYQRTFLSPNGGTHNETPKCKMLLRWPSITHIYCFVEIALYLCTMHLSLIWYFASAHGIPAFERKPRAKARRAADPQAYCLQQISESRCLLQQTSSSELNLRMAGGAKCRSKERSDVASK